jgi:hypothetical protein
MPRVASLAALLLLLAALASPLGTGEVAAASPQASPPSRSVPHAGLDAADRWIVVLRPGASPDGARLRASELGVAADRTFRSAVHGYAARLSPGQVAALREDPTVEAVVPDAVVTMEAQSTPRGVRRVFATPSAIARIDGSDERVDADVAIVDTGVDPSHPDLNVVGGVNCTSSNPAAWHDGNGHGTHVAGIVGAIDNGTGVVGVAPGARLWAVRILNANGVGLLSWYVCGLDWITAQRDPSDPTRPLIEAANMSVAKPGSDDHDCGLTNSDVLHRAICRLVASGVTVVAAAGNNSFSASRLIPASYNEVITVSALADTDGRPGGVGGNACYSWGSYDRDDTFANFSNYGRDVDLIAPGKCIWSTVPGNGYAFLSGTSMATPHVTGAVALYKSSRPLATPAQVRAALIAAGNFGWKLGTDPDAYHEPLLDVSHIVNLGDFALAAVSPPRVLSGAGGAFAIAVNAIRAEDFTDPIGLSLTADAPLEATLTDLTLAGAGDTRSTLDVGVPAGTSSGTYRVTVTGTTGDRTRSVRVSIRVDADRPVAAAPSLGVRAGTRFAFGSLQARASWRPASDPTSAIAGYQVQWSVNGGAWGGTATLGATSRTVARSLVVGRTYGVRVRARDAAGNWSPWSAANPYRASVVQDGSPSLVSSGRWRVARSSSASGGTTRFARAHGAWIGRAFTGRAVAVVAPLGRSRGAAQVWIDGVHVKTIHLHSRRSHARRVVFARSWLTSGAHTLRIVVVGTAHHPRVDLDAIVIIR